MNEHIIKHSGDREPSRREGKGGIKLVAKTQGTKRERNMSREITWQMKFVRNGRLPGTR